MKKLITATMLSAAFLNASAKAPKETGKVTIVATLTIEDFNEWQKAFDAGSPVREKAGIKVLQVCSLAENSKRVMVIEEAADLRSAKDFIEILKKRSKPGTTDLDIKLYNQHS